MVKLLIDTCVWLDLAKDSQQKALLGVLEELVSLNEVSLLVPRIVVDEFARNKARVAEENQLARPGLGKGTKPDTIVPNGQWATGKNQTKLR
jgi:hypothetical protein